MFGKFLLVCMKKCTME